MKSMYNNRLYICICLAVIAMSSGVVADEEKSMKNEYERVLNSLMGGEMIFSCGGDDEIFKISSNIFNQPKLFWKDGVEWTELERTTFKSVGVVFRGLGLTGGLPLSEFNFHEIVPIYNHGDLISGQPTEKDYFSKIENERFVPYEYTVDMLSGLMTLTNIEPVVDHFRFRFEKYAREQALPDEFVVTLEDKKNNNIKRQERNEDISKVISETPRVFEVETPARSFKMTRYCSLI
ncbi:hypothetical protein JGK46_003892 [Aeromonas bestiarum]|nr:hypothetical protein [Aeromonas bestiarum]